MAAMPTSRFFAGDKSSIFFMGTKLHEFFLTQVARVFNTSYTSFFNTSCTGFLTQVTWVLKSFDEKNTSDINGFAAI